MSIKKREAHKTTTPKAIAVSETKRKETPKIPLNSKKTIQVLYAQAIDNGFQLVNTKPEVVFKVLKTSVKDVFILNSKNGILCKVGEKWIAEYYENNQLKQDIYEIKF